jgi:hypothetical protein
MQPDMDKVELNVALNNHNLGQVPDSAHINRVHTIRNAAQHEARVPNETELSECYIYTRDFLASFTRQIWDIELNDISLVSSVQNTVIRDLMEKAEIALSQGDILETIKQSRYALTWGIRQVRYTFVSRPVRSPLGDVQSYGTNLNPSFPPRDVPQSTWQVLLIRA